MRRLLILLVAAAGCSSEPTKKERENEPRTISAASSGASTAPDYASLEPYSGQYVTLSGRFSHDRAIHGIVVLDSGLRVYIPHFDLYARGDDWLKYVGHRCSAGGILHTWTKDIPGYHGPTLQIQDFSGSTGE